MSPPGVELKFLGYLGKVSSSTLLINCIISDRSPVFSHLSASLQGLVTIRTFRVQDAFMNMYHRLQDNHGGNASIPRTFLRL